MTNPVLIGLIRRRAELDGEGIRLRKRLEQITLDLARLDAAIGVFDREMNANTIRPVRVRAPNVVMMGHCPGGRWTCSGRPGSRCQPGRSRRG